nr:Gag-Pol polyprotein [Tanacetum cinerariifolium]
MQDFGYGDCWTESRGNNVVGCPHGFIIQINHGIMNFKKVEKVTKMSDIDDRWINLSWIFGSFVPSFEWDSPFTSTKSTIQELHLIDFLHFPRNRLATFSTRLVSPPMSVGSPATLVVDLYDEDDDEIIIVEPTDENVVTAPNIKATPPYVSRKGVVAPPQSSGLSRKSKRLEPAEGGPSSLVFAGRRIGLRDFLAKLSQLAKSSNKVMKDDYELLRNSYWKYKENVLRASLDFCLKKMSRDVLTVGSTMRIPLLYRGEYSQWVERASLDFCLKKMSRDVLTVGSTMRIPLLYRREYSQWVKRFMNYLEEQTDGEAMINSIKNGDQPLPRVTQVSIVGTSSTEQPPLKDKSMWKAAVWYEYETFKATEGELLLDTYIRYLQWKQYAIIMRQNKNLMDINIDALYNILKQNQGDVNDAMGLKKKTIMVTSDPLALIAKKTRVSKSKEKVVVSLNSEGSDADDFSELKKITALLAKAFNRRKFYSKPTNNNLRTSSTSQSANKKQEFVKTDDKKIEKKDDEKSET